MPNKANPSKHRVRVERGIYRYYNGNYAVVYMENGRPRFKTVGKNLTAARRERERLNVAVREGRLVAAAGHRTFEEVAEEWLEHFESRVLAGDKAPRTLERYRSVLRRHVYPELGKRPINNIRKADIVRLITALRKKGLKPWTIRGVLVPTSRVFRYGSIEDEALTNPVRELDRDERPTASKRHQRILKDSEIVALLRAATPAYAPVLAAATFTGMRISELLGLRWGDIDMEAGVIRVTHQLSVATRDTPAQRVRLKTEAGQRNIPLLPQLAAYLRHHKLASAYSGDGDYVFTTAVGTPMMRRNVLRRGLTAAADAAGLNPDDKPRLRLHDLRHTFASHLIVDLKVDVVYVSRILGHADASITLAVYADLIDEERHAKDVRTRMGASDFGAALDTYLTRRAS